MVFFWCLIYLFIWFGLCRFERYLHDYLKKKNMHQTAEIFRREADVTIDPAVPICNSYFFRFYIYINLLIIIEEI